MTYYYTYKITCLKGRLKDHYYYGQHHTDDLDDGYCGSGSIIRKYYKKHKAIEGVTYTKEILGFYSNATELNEAEKVLIGDNYKNDPMCLNITHGSYKEWTEEARKNASESAKLRTDRKAWNKDKHMPEGFGEKISNYFKEHGHPFKGKHHTEETKQLQREKAIGRPSAWKGQHHTEEARNIQREKALKRPKRCWVYKDGVEYLINKSELNDYISNGYIKGRLLNIWGVNKTKKPDSEETRYNKGKSFRGKRWINNGIIQKGVYEDELSDYLSNGWVLGYVKTNKNTNKKVA